MNRGVRYFLLAVGAWVSVGIVSESFAAGLGAFYLMYLAAFAIETKREFYG